MNSPKEQNITQNKPTTNDPQRIESGHWIVRTTDWTNSVLVSRLERGYIIRYNSVGISISRMRLTIVLKLDF